MTDAYARPHPVDENVRCRYCHAKLAEFAGHPYRFRCRKCKAITQSPDAEAYKPSVEASADRSGA
jgi:phage FluMu protein Com